MNDALIMMMRSRRSSMSSSLGTGNRLTGLSVMALSQMRIDNHDNL